MTIDEDSTIDTSADAVMIVTFLGTPQSVVFTVSPGDGYDTVKYRYDNTGNYTPYNSATGIVYALNDNHALLNIQVTGSGEPAVETTNFTIALAGIEPPIPEEPDPDAPVP